MTPADVVLMLGWPFGLALVILLLLWRPWCRDVDGLPAWTPCVALAAAYPLGHATFSSFPGFPPVTADEWLVYAAIAGGGWGILESRWMTQPTVVRRGVRLGFLAVLFWLAAGDHIGVLPVVVLTAGVYSALTVLEQNARSHAAPTMLWVLTISAASAAPILLLGHSLKLAFLACSLAAVTVAAALITTVFTSGRHLYLSPLLLPWCAVLTGLFISGVLFANAPLFSALGIAAAAVLPFSFVRTNGGWRKTVAGIFALFVLSGGSVGFAYYETQIETDEKVEAADDGAEVDSEDDPYTW